MENQDNLNSYGKRQSTDANAVKKQIVELSYKNFKRAMIKVLQQTTVNILKSNLNRTKTKKCMTRNIIKLLKGKTKKNIEISQKKNGIIGRRTTIQIIVSSH